MKYRKSLVLYAAMWIGIVLIAFVMQAIPLLLMITMVNMAFGISSPAALVALPVALFGAVVFACVRAERQRRDWRQPVDGGEQRRQLAAVQEDGGLRLTEIRRRWFY